MQTFHCVECLKRISTLEDEIAYFNESSCAKCAASKEQMMRELAALELEVVF